MFPYLRPPPPPGRPHGLCRPRRRNLLGRVVYGDLLTSPAASNRAGRVHRVYDGAGVATTQAFDFEGHPTSEQRQFVAGKTSEPDWIALLGQSTIAAMATAASLEDMLESQVALIRVDPNTGVPVDAEGRWLAQGSAEYLVFSTSDEARQFAEEDAQRALRIEYTVLSRTGKLVWRMQTNVESTPPAKRNALGAFYGWFSRLLHRRGSEDGEDPGRG